jgi:alkylation response protein AidB-like acyl-CoA dehydrogenase
MAADTSAMGLLADAIRHFVDERLIPAARDYRDVRLYWIYEGTSEIQRITPGRDALRAGMEG